MPATPDPADPLLVACLCAAWCRTCDEYVPVFEGLQRQFDDQARFVWVDIEDEDEAMGAVDVENFPTLLIARGERVAFFGTVTPHAGTAATLVERALRDELPQVNDPALAGLPGRLRALDTR